MLQEDREVTTTSHGRMGEERLPRGETIITDRQFDSVYKGWR